MFRLRDQRTAEAASRDRGRTSLWALLPALLTLVLGLSAAPVAAQDETTAPAGSESVTGLPLPRFVTTRSTPINVRVGPGTRYEVAWVYVKAGTPVEIIAEFDTWRKIRDFDGSEGWVHQNLLTGSRAGLVAPWRTGERIALLAGRSTDGGVRAYLGPGFRVDISECDGQWCAVSATDHPEEGRPTTYSGYLPQAELWGVYANEEFD